MLHLCGEAGLLGEGVPERKGRAHLHLSALLDRALGRRLPEAGLELEGGRDRGGGRPRVRARGAHAGLGHLAWQRHRRARALAPTWMLEGDQSVVWWAGGEQARVCRAALLCLYQPRWRAVAAALQPRGAGPQGQQLSSRTPSRARWRRVRRWRASSTLPSKRQARRAPCPARCESPRDPPRHPRRAQGRAGRRSRWHPRR